jgi:hypothetical protein
MIKQDYILLILNCKKYKHKADKQKETWLKELPSNIIYFHIIGDMELTTEYLFDTNILYVKTLDDYISLPHKVIAAYKAIQETYDFKYVFKTDDDQHLKNIKFFEIVINLINKNCNDYGGYSLQIKPHMSTYYLVHPELPNNIYMKKTCYCNGRFYFLSTNAVLNLLTKYNEIKSEYFEDYAIGLYLDEKYKTNLLHLITNNFFIDVL